jgi:hypothetical protein
MNGFDVHAVGWVVTRDVCCEGARTCLGLKSRLSRVALEELGKHWARVANAVHDDRAAMTLGERLLLTGSGPLSRKSEARMREFLERLVTLCPERYGRQGLNLRSLLGFVRVAVGAFSFLLLGHYGSPENPTLGQAAIVALLIGCWFLATTFQLRRMHGLVVHLLGEKAESPRRTEGETGSET